MSELPRTCQREDGQRKLMYLTRGLARAAARRFERARGHALRTYHCPNCLMFHIASQRDRDVAAPVRSDRLLLVGEAPNRTVDVLPRPDWALTGSSGRRLADLAGVPWLVYLRRTERTNLLETWPGETWPVAEARMAAFRVLPQLAERRTILVGARVARAFGLMWDPFSFALRLEALVPDADVAMIPHPSGRSRWWNDPRNVERARAFLRPAFAPPAAEAS